MKNIDEEAMAKALEGFILNEIPEEYLEKGEYK